MLPDGDEDNEYYDFIRDEIMDELAEQLGADDPETLKILEAYWRE